MQDTSFKFVQVARQRGALFSIDPNCRPSKIDNREEYFEGMIRFLRAAVFIKLSDEDLHYFYPELTDDALEIFAQEYLPQLCIYTVGSGGRMGQSAFAVSVRIPAVLPGAPADASAPVVIRCIGSRYEEFRN